MTVIHWFDEINADHLEDVGGKGANLGELTKAGLPVPPGFCLSAHAYRDFLRQSALDGHIRATLAGITPGDPSQSEQVARGIQARLLEQSLPASTAEAVKQAYLELGMRSGLADASLLRVAVRSSATAEDLPDASFAGQQETYLNVVGADELLDRVHHCWASLWTPRAFAYREKQGFEHLKVAIAVVVQMMVPAEVAGVLFTANPLSGNRDEVVLDASWGLGEAVVSGMVTPDTYVLRKQDGVILSHIVGSKEVTLSYAPDGGLLEEATPEARRRQPALSSQETGELTALGRRIEAHYGTPQDIEWAIAAGRCYALQARAITTLSDAQTRTTTEDEYNRTMFIEIFPDPLSPIFLSVICPLFKEMLDFTLLTWGFQPDESIEAVGAFYNQPYFNRAYLAAALNPLSPQIRDRLVDQLVNPFGRHEQSMRGELSPAYIAMMARMLRFMVRFPSQLPDLVASYRSQVAQVSALAVEDLSDAEIVGRIRTLVFEAASRFLNYDFLMIALIGITYQLLGSLLERHYGEDTELLRAKLISGVTGNVTMETNIQLWDLAQSAKASQPVSTLLRQEELGKVQARLAKIPEGREFLRALEGFLTEYGHREIRMDILHPTWSEDPTPVLSFVRGYLDADATMSPHLQQARLVDEREQATKQVLSQVERGMAGRLIMSPFFRWILNQTQVHTRERDTMHFELTRLFPPFRQLLLELGERWQNAGNLDQQEDIFFMTLEELEAQVEAPAPRQQTVAQRRETFAANRERPWPDIIRGAQEVYAQQGQPDDDQKTLSGIPGSPGVSTGTVKIIRGPDEFERLKKGDILIAPITNPVWTPLFALASAVVTEVGGILSHGAIVAREYGIPAVMSVAGVTTRLQDGQRVTVNGDRGLVLLQEPA
jgi:pyruvate,water dikinase